VLTCKHESWFFLKDNPKNLIHHNFIMRSTLSLSYSYSLSLPLYYPLSFFLAHTLASSLRSSSTSVTSFRHCSFKLTPVTSLTGTDFSTDTNSLYSCIQQSHYCDGLFMHKRQWWLEYVRMKTGISACARTYMHSHTYRYAYALMHARTRNVNCVF